MKCEEIEVALSGYLDRELTQQIRQRVEIHLRNCQRCQQVLEEIQRVQSSTSRLALERPTKEEWQKMQVSILERISRKLGWLIFTVWSALTAFYGIYKYATEPDEPLIQKILFFGIIVGIAVIFLSVLSQRIRESRTDHYKGVEK